MRNAFISSLTEEARTNSNIVLLMAEVGFSVVEGFEAEFPGRFYNTGIAEQNLVSVAAGMALRGLRPVAYSMACFLPSRAFEQIKVDACYQNLPLVLAGVGTALSYGGMGGTHHAIEDIAIMSALPNLTVLCPADPKETAALLNQALELEGPCYIAIGKNNDPVLTPKEAKIKIGKANWLQEGADITILSTGGILENALKAVKILEQKGHSVGLASIHTVKPIDTEALAKAFRSSAVFTVDEHTVYGGFSAIVSAYAAQNGQSKKLLQTYAIPDRFVSTVGGRDYQLKGYGLDGEALAADMLRRLR